MTNISNQPIIQLTNPSLPGRTWHGSESVLNPGRGKGKNSTQQKLSRCLGDLSYLGDA